MIQKNKAVFGVKGKMLKIHNKVEDIVSNKYDCADFLRKWRKMKLKVKNRYKKTRRD